MVGTFRDRMVFFALCLNGLLISSALGIAGSAKPKASDSRADNLWWWPFPPKPGHEFTIPDNEKDTKLKLRVVWLENPSNEAVLAWDGGDAPSDQSFIKWDYEDHGEIADLYPNQVPIHHVKPYKGMRNFFVKLTGLAADKTVYFLLKNGENTSRRYFFKTAPDRLDRPILFISGGDSRNNRIPRRKANLLVSKILADAVLFGGDYTDRGSNKQWAQWFEDWQLTNTPEGRLTPIVPTRGNHEWSNEVISFLFGAPARNYYKSAIAGGDIEIYTLNTESAILGEQTHWLAAELTVSNAKYRIAQYHKPMRPHVRRKSEGQTHYGAWANIFYQKQVKMVMESDSHAVKATWPIIPQVTAGNDEGFVRNDKLGTVYLGEGCWGAPLRTADDSKSWTRAVGSFNQFKLIRIDAKRMDIRTIVVENAEQVSRLSNQDGSQLPERIRVWEPEGGAVISIPPVMVLEQPE